MSLGPNLRLAVPCAALALLGFLASDARAQGTPPVPKESTSLQVPASNSGMLVDFDKPEVKPTPDPADISKPIEPTRVERSLCSTGNTELDVVVREASQRYGVDPCLVVAVINQESGFRRYAVSPKGASGYMQLMPDTARRFGVVDMFDPRQNIHAGTRYLRFLLERFSGSVELALAGYNAGESAVERFGRRIPPYLETQNYVRSITGRYYSLNTARVALTSPVAAVDPAPMAVGPYRPSASWRISVQFDETQPSSTPQ